MRIKKISIIVFLLWTILFIFGCKKSPEELAESYAEPVEFSNYEEFLEAKVALTDAYFCYEEELIADQVESVNVDSVFEVVNVYYEDREDVRIHYYGIFNQSEKREVAVVKKEELPVTYK